MPSFTKRENARANTTLHGDTIAHRAKHRGGDTALKAHGSKVKAQAINV